MTATVIRFPVERRAEPAASAVPDADGDWGVRAHAVLDLAERLVDREPADVVELCRQAFDLLAGAEADIDDDVTVHVVAGRLGALHRQACEQSGVHELAVAHWISGAWRRCPSLARHFVAGAQHPTGHGRPISAAIADTRRRHPTGRRIRGARTAG